MHISFYMTMLLQYWYTATFAVLHQYVILGSTASHAASIAAGSYFMVTTFFWTRAAKNDATEVKAVTGGDITQEHKGNLS